VGAVWPVGCLKTGRSVFLDILEIKGEYGSSTGLRLQPSFSVAPTPLGWDELPTVSKRLIRPRAQVSYPIWGTEPHPPWTPKDMTRQQDYEFSTLNVVRTRIPLIEARSLMSPNSSSSVTGVVLPPLICEVLSKGPGGVSRLLSENFSKDSDGRCAGGR